MRRQLAALLSGLALLAGLAGCAAQAAPEPNADGVTTIRYQNSVGQVNLLELADALGYLDGIRLDYIGDVTGGPEQLRTLVIGEADVALGPFLGATSQLVATGAPLKVVVSTYGSNAKITQSLLTLEGSPIRDARDLIGKKVAVNTLGANYEAVLDYWLLEEGLTQDEIDQVTLVPLPPLNSEQSLRQGQVDAAYMSGGFAAVAQKNGGVREVMRDVDVMGPYNGGGAVVTEQFLETNPEAATTVTTGLAKAVRYVESHSKPEVLKVYAPYLEQHGRGSYLEAIEANWTGSTGVARPDASLKDQDFSIWLDWLESRGDVETDGLEPHDIYTNEFNEEAGR